MNEVRAPVDTIVLRSCVPDCRRGSVSMRIFKIWRLSGLEPFRDGDLLILPNRKIPQILLLTIYDIRVHTSEPKIAGNRRVWRRDLSGAARANAPWPASAITRTAFAGCLLPLPPRVGSSRPQVAFSVFPQAPSANPIPNFVTRLGLAGEPVWLGHGATVDAAPHACPLS